MPSLFISDIEDAVLEGLRGRATDSKRSVEQEAREVLRDAVGNRTMTNVPHAACDEPVHIVELAKRLFGREWGFDLEIPSRDTEPDRPVPLS